jgi:hypothetical protein
MKAIRHCAGRMLSDIVQEECYQTLCRKKAIRHCAGRILSVIVQEECYQTLEEGYETLCRKIQECYQTFCRKKAIRHCAGRLLLDSVQEEGCCQTNRRTVPTFAFCVIARLTAGLWLQLQLQLLSLVHAMVDFGHSPCYG